MGLVSGIVVFLMVWWTVLFAVLPWGNRPSEAPVTGNTTSAPDKPKILKKFMVTTLVSAIIWLLIYGLITSNVISFYDMAADLAAQDEQTQNNAHSKMETQK
ncbi:MAG: hypothetical protein A3J37_03080 [Alphaproteobacteria bacterium RIFCSPHIGHO2_12_FULL_45_9]|nr:MAG: hypothetical protein A3B66_09185 [Alphaproteobacteria bacterium RIFCSPHIGHO2_02_FULL_46_13]OFW95682.1 MAG: hypothetical protein A3J37_03080 [Alphaproteobacteria bacterium RIFCSPHIGHO2_12_FULL_45_9]